MLTSQQLIKLLAVSFGVALAVIAALVYFLAGSRIPSMYGTPDSLSSISGATRMPPADVLQYDSKIITRIGGPVVSISNDRLTIATGFHGNSTTTMTVLVNGDTKLLRQTSQKDSAAFQKEMDAFLAKIDHLPQSSTIYVAPSQYVEEKIVLSDIKMGDVVGLYVQPVNGSKDVLATSVEVLLPPPPLGK